MSEESITQRYNELRIDTMCDVLLDESSLVDTRIDAAFQIPATPPYNGLDVYYSYSRPYTSIISICNINFKIYKFVALYSLMMVCAIISLTTFTLYSEDPCCVDMRYISVHYLQWVDIHSWTNVSIVLCYTWCGFLVLAPWDTARFIALLFAICTMFQIAWYILGCVLYVVEVYPHCSVKSPLWIYATGSLAVQTITWLVFAVQNKG